jgi:5-methylcytosine-specific restriction endonuclease McrA
MTEEERKQRRRESQLKWRAKNPDYMKQWAHSNRDKTAKADKTYYDSNLPKILEKNRKWREANPDKVKVQKQRDYAKNKEKRIATVARYQNENKEYYAELKARRRARTKESDELTQFCFQEAMDLRRLREETTGFKWHIDHIVPLKHKDACGLHTAANFQVVPAGWNCQKGNRSMDKYFP